ncbi:MAG TPA: 1-deoxy-D-xylulose-5-phosphate reductoisomerase [Bacillales bacterium]|nr:1-deoxy-D-xylulose-5-phosphate reductoisomerase [Bacillales bacterium]
MKRISLLGATGSVGRQTLDVISDHPDQFSLVAMSFGKNVSSGLDIIHTYQPSLVAVGTKEIRDEIVNMVPSDVKIVYGKEGLIEAAVYPEATVVLNALLGSVGLAPTLAAIDAGKNLAFANKETLVMAGHLVMEAAERKGVQVLPVDSEHSAIFQCLQGEDPNRISKLIITASGGSFRDKKREELEGVTVEEALNHPNWSMGAKITIDSATMMNKGLEVIEAHWLFDMPYEQIDVVLHRESVIHSMVEFKDTSVIAQLGLPDMRVPIQYALSYPNRLELKGAKGLNLWEMRTLHFQEKDLDRFRCLRFAYEAGKIGGTMPTVLNAANEEAVQLFLEGNITFLDIESRVEAALERHDSLSYPNLQEIQAVDQETREFVRSLDKK